MCYNYTHCKVQVAPNLTKSVISCISGIWTWPTGGCCSPAHSTSSSSRCLLLVIIHKTNCSLWLHRAPKSEQGESLIWSVNALVYVGRKLPRVSMCVPHTVQEKRAHSCVHTALYNGDWAPPAGETGTGDLLLKYV